MLTRHHCACAQTGGAAFMREGPNLLKLARKEQCMALLMQLRTGFKLDGRVYRVYPSGEVQYLHPKDGVYPEKVNKGRVGANNVMRSIGKNPEPASVRARKNLGSPRRRFPSAWLTPRLCYASDQVLRQAGPVRGVSLRPAFAFSLRWREDAPWNGTLPLRAASPVLRAAAPDAAPTASPRRRVVTRTGVNGLFQLPPSLSLAAATASFSAFHV
jgi:hypothetical protein